MFGRLEQGLCNSESPHTLLPIYQLALFWANYLSSSPGNGASLPRKSPTVSRLVVGGQLHLQSVFSLLHTKPFSPHLRVGLTCRWLSSQHQVQGNRRDASFSLLHHMKPDPLRNPSFSTTHGSSASLHRTLTCHGWVPCGLNLGIQASFSNRSHGSFLIQQELSAIK